LAARGIAVDPDARLAAMCALFKDRCATVVELADWLSMYFVDVVATPADREAHVTDAVRPALASLRETLAATDWNKTAIQQAIKQTIVAHGLKMSQLAMALRVLVCGRPQTPSIDAVLELFARERVLARLRAG
jgi:glutamyl-tRNA synthetase